jgi:hypothetical protein
LLTTLEDSESWQPVYLTSEQWVIIDSLCRGRRIRFADESLIAFLREQGLEGDLDQFWNELLASGLVARSSDSVELMLITTNCQSAFLPDGKIVAAENNTGRLTRWIDRHYSDSSKAGDEATNTPPILL